MTKPNLTRYSRGGRVVAEHTAAMADGLWLVHFYDIAGRQVLSDEVSLSASQLSTLQNTFSIASYTSATSCAGYTLTPAAPFSITTPAYAAYFDSYDFRSKCSDSRMPTVSASRKGLMTGSFDGLEYSSSGKGYFTVLQYDDWGRLVRSDRQTEKGILTDHSTYDRIGNVTAYTSTLTRTDGTTLSMSGTNTLDGAGRVKKWSVQLGDASAGADIVYGNYGSVKKETFGNEVVRNYSYDCHGWLTEVNTIPSLIESVLPTSDVSTQVYAETSGMESPSANITTGIGYTEQILYADGNRPRYDGTADFWRHQI